MHFPFLLDNFSLTIFYSIINLIYSEFYSLLFLSLTAAHGYQNLKEREREGGRIYINKEVGVHLWQKFVFSSQHYLARPTVQSSNPSPQLS